MQVNKTASVQGNENHLITNQKQRPRSQFGSHSALSTIGGLRTNEQYFADMTQFLERRDLKVQRLKKRLAKEEDQRNREAFETVSNKSKRSFGMVSKKSFQEIRENIRVRSGQKRKEVLDSLTPNFKPTLIANSDRQLWRRSSLGDLRRASPNSPMQAALLSCTGMLVSDWRNKSALQRFADDLQQRQVNMEAKMSEQEGRIQASLAQTCKANTVSDEYLVRNFFADFLDACQQVLPPQQQLKIK